MARFRLRKKATSQATGVVYAGTVMSVAEEGARSAYQWAMNQTPAKVWESQPYVRTVVDFLASQVAHLGLHVYRRVSDTDRVRVQPSESRFARVLARPNPQMTMWELVYALVADDGLYDRAYWAVGRDTLRRIPPSWVADHLTPRTDPFTVSGIVVNNGINGATTSLTGNEFVPFVRFNPLTVSGIPQSRLNAVKEVLAEQAAAYEFRRLSWQNGAQANRWIERPADAPDWSGGAKERFMEDLRAWFSRGGSRTGGTPILEEGMTLNSEQWNAREAEWTEAIKVSLNLTAGIYHVNGWHVGLTEQTHYGNAVEARRGLYVDTLGPITAYLEQRINQFVRPLFTDDEDEYAEFNINEKLEGSFTEQAQAFQAAVGAPWMTRDEARARMNLPAVEGADELIVPLNVTRGGIASPRDTAPPPAAAAGSARSKSAAIQIKAEPAAGVVERAGELLKEFFDRQGRSVMTRAGASADLDYIYQSDRWHGEIADVLMQVSILASSEAGRKTLEQLGVDPEEWDQDRADAWLRENADGIATGVNETVRGRVEEGLADDQLPHTYEVLAGAYAATAAVSHVTAVTGWASMEAPRQQGLEVTKTWIVTSSNPRDTHAALNGETVGEDERFSNGARWPGDTQLSSDERAGCTCALGVNVG